MNVKYCRKASLLGAAVFLWMPFAAGQIDTKVSSHRFENVVLEMSLKPFKQNDPAYIRAVANEVFIEWLSLLRHADTVSVMLWTGDGSEILEYQGNFEQRLEWARYMGNPNTEHEVGSGPESLSLHERAYLYMDNPPEFSYGDLAFVIKAIKEAGRRVTHKPILVGATFDPGPEFAKSDFKYRRHPEILGGNAMGHKTFVSCYSVLEGDDASYAGFPDGIPDGTPFGTFFGRQSQHFMDDLGFDYLWLSNGFGFGAEGWSATGALFDGKRFDAAKLPVATAKVLDFWRLFRRECPEYPIQTRGTNLSTGVDLARDAVDLRKIYEGGFNMLPPPNSPWAALDGDFGLEMAGYMSRMAELPDYRFPFRYYTHDPWWLNSPWLDRYGREPHDIYLPMAVSRIDGKGNIGIPTQVNFLTIDDSYGNMPKQVPDEVIPHILKARYDAPDAPAPLVWVYPFKEYHDWAYDHPERLPEIYYGDWFIRQAINNGLPLNTVISTTSFGTVAAQQPGFFEASVLLSIAPEAGSPLEKALISFVENGGRLIVYGPAEHAGTDFLAMLNLKNEAGLAGVFTIESDYTPDLLEKPYPLKINHRALESGGELRSVIADTADEHTRSLVRLAHDGIYRDVLWTRSLPEWNGGKVAYIRGTNSSSFTGGRLLTPDDPSEYFPGSLWLRYVLKEFGMEFLVAKDNPGVKNPVMTVSRSDNAFVFSGYSPNSTVGYRFRFDYGAPLLLGLETVLEEGYSGYTFPTSWHRECRIFVSGQRAGMVSYKELHSGEKGITKRYKISGLKNATVRIFPGKGVNKEDFHAYLNAGYPWKTGQIEFAEGDQKRGKHFVVENVTGSLVISW